MFSTARPQVVFWWKFSLPGAVYLDLPKFLIIPNLGSKRLHLPASEVIEVLILTEIVITGIWLCWGLRTVEPTSSMELQPHCYGWYLSLPCSSWQSLDSTATGFSISFYIWMLIPSRSLSWPESLIPACIIKVVDCFKGEKGITSLWPNALVFYAAIV